MMGWSVYRAELIILPQAYIVTFIEKEFATSTKRNAR
jgi:hypothetical protein